jgi:hypothetical protein
MLAPSAIQRAEDLVGIATPTSDFDCALTCALTDIRVTPKPSASPVNTDLIFMPYVSCYEWRVVVVETAPPGFVVQVVQVTHYAVALFCGLYINDFTNTFLMIF